MIAATDEERAAYLDLTQRYRFLYRMGLQARLATQGGDIVDWWGMGVPGARPPPAAEPEARWGDLPDRVRETIRAVAQERGVSPADIVGDRRTGRIADARLECYRRLRAMSWRGDRHPSLLQIGLWLQRDHTTVHHGVNKR
jgi:hypothetical protein